MMEIILLCVLNGVLIVWLDYKSKQYRKLLAKYEIVADELCGYLDADIKDSGSEWGNVR